jgi:Zn finger protein HypA/HybF involved in hydrogenase expression
MFCEHCGTKTKEGAQFCQSCGKSTSGINSHPQLSEENSESLVKCDECKYTGPGELSRRTLSQILAWLSIFVSPLITLGYYEYTHKYQCPNCESTSLHVKNKKGVFVNQKRTKTVTKVIIWIFVGLFVTGIIYTIISSIK